MAASQHHFWQAYLNANPPDLTQGTYHAKPASAPHAWGTPIWRPDPHPQDCSEVNHLFWLYFGERYLSLSVLLADCLRNHLGKLNTCVDSHGEQAAAARQLLPEPAAVPGQPPPRRTALAAADHRRSFSAPTTLRGPVLFPRPQRRRSSSCLTHRLRSPRPGSRIGPRPGRPTGVSALRASRAAAPGGPGLSLPSRSAPAPPGSHPERAVASFSSRCEFLLCRDAEPEAAPQALPPPAGSSSLRSQGRDHL